MFLCGLLLVGQTNRITMSSKNDYIGGESVTLSLKDLVLINNALNEIINGPSAIEPWEFQTRTGVTIEEAKTLLSRIGSAIEHQRAS